MISEETPGEPTRTFLLPWWCRWVGGSLLLAGAVMGFISHYYRWAPEALDLKVFAISSFYLERKVATVVQNNMTQEIAGSMALIGLVAIAGSAERTESPRTARLRLAAFQLALLGHGALLLGAILFTFGLSFVEALIPVAVSFPLLYLIAFAVLRHIGRDSHGSREPR